MMSDRYRMKSVVVATDFSAGAASAAARAALLPLARDATIHLVHVLPGEVPASLAEAVKGRAAGALDEAAEDLRRRVSRRGADGPKVEHALLGGKPYAEIIRFARWRGADLVVVGRHGPRALRDALIGSTAERVIRKGDVPVLLVNEEARDPYGRALVALDLSETSRREADLALSLLPDDAREISLVHAYHLSLGSWLAETVLDAYRREAHDEALKRAKDVAALIEPAGIACRTLVREGDPRLTVLREVMQGGSELLVLGTHGRSGVAHALLGSVAEWLVRTAPCDVAVTRPARFTFELP